MPIADGVDDKLRPNNGKASLLFHSLRDYPILGTGTPGFISDFHFRILSWRKNGTKLSKRAGELTGLGRTGTLCNFPQTGLPGVNRELPRNGRNGVSSELNWPYWINEPNFRANFNPYQFYLGQNTNRDKFFPLKLFGFNSFSEQPRKTQELGVGNYFERFRSSGIPECNVLPVHGKGRVTFHKFYHRFFPLGRLHWGPGGLVFGIT